jgi:hypothetical protein
LAAQHQITLCSSRSIEPKPSKVSAAVTFRDFIKANNMDDKLSDIPDARISYEVLQSDPFFRFIGHHITNPWMLGTVLSIIILLMLIFGPSTESRFIYTDF